MFHSGRLILALRCTLPLQRMMKENIIESHYEQQAFEAAQRMRQAQNYPGPIRAAVPGDTTHYLSDKRDHAQTILHDSDRHYWRPVVDDTLVQASMMLRVRFKNDVWVTTGWEKRMYVLQITVRSGHFSQ